MRFEVIAARDVVVGDVLIHASPARGKVPAHTTDLRVLRIEDRGGVRWFYTNVFDTARSLGEGVAVRREVKMDSVLVDLLVERAKLMEQVAALEERVAGLLPPEGDERVDVLRRLVTDLGGYDTEKGLAVSIYMVRQDIIARRIAARASMATTKEGE